MSLTRAIKLFGTEEKVTPPTRLTAGALTAELDGGNLRYITLGGREALRAIAFLVRDRNWGTYNATISDLKIEQGKDSFSVSYDALCKDADQAFRYSATIKGSADGSLTFAAHGEALTDFVTNRTGFVVLHALEGVVDHPVKVEHVDGRVVDDKFPLLVNPACPYQDIRALTHEVAPGLKVSCRMEGDAFEMEDHRNWMDASYKTYVRPLALPWPYTIKKGETTSQSVRLTIEGKLPRPAAGGAADGVTVEIGGALRHAMPAVGLAAPAEHAAAAIEAADLIRAAKPAFLVCAFDARKGHDAETMERHRTLGEKVGAPLALEAVLPCLDDAGKPTGDNAVLRRDMAHVADAARAAGVTFERVAVSPSSDLKCTLPGSVFPPAPSWAELMDVARAAFPGVPVGGGMFSYFTELNRKRPPADLLDFICHTGAPVVHAGDDVSVTETLEALPSIFTSVRAFGGGKPYWVFPTAISMRDNPYGAVPAENPNNIRQAMNRVDPRDRALLGAAWYAGYLARAAAAGVDAVTLGATAGPSGIVYSKQDHAQPGFDGTDAKVMPHYHVIAGHTALAGARLNQTESSAPRNVQALCAETADGRALWLANLTGAAQPVTVKGMTNGRLRILDEASFETACKDPDAFAVSGSDWSGRIELAPYAVATVTGG